MEKSSEADEHPRETCEQPLDAREKAAAPEEARQKRPASTREQRDKTRAERKKLQPQQQLTREKREERKKREKEKRAEEERKEVRSHVTFGTRHAGCFGNLVLHHRIIVRGSVAEQCLSIIIYSTRKMVKGGFMLDKLRTNLWYILIVSGNNNWFCVAASPHNSMGP